MQQEQVLQDHSRLNEKQRKIEESYSITIEEYKTKILCIQCGKEAEKIKCEECAKESFHKRNAYFIFSGSWVVSSVIVFFTSNVYVSVPIGLCCGTILSNAYNTMVNF
jgi:ribosomal protein L37E